MENPQTLSPAALANAVIDIQKSLPSLPPAAVETLREAAHRLTKNHLGPATPAALSSADDELSFIARLSDLLPDRLTTQQLSMLFSYLLFRFDIPARDAGAIVSSALEFHVLHGLPLAEDQGPRASDEASPTKH
jgi:hypothetical protein